MYAYTAARFHLIDPFCSGHSDHMETNLNALLLLSPTDNFLSDQASVATQ